ncbi:hypothetical protein N5E02_04830 [Stenotrophomonas sp. GD03777]|uniref:hypothetical protein n=1 Tax=Stenotrophomonas sp. GD03777 TaxID=2975380 RepID=UPI00244AFA24|nr:hypothetical protein [Stenotrophomonas sp. GD03777]MDH1660738.1 hypothetical protein [Stenotrophomonas sp. GD03777]
MNDIDQTALEIARAFIPVDVVGQQRANLQVAIIEAIKKHANPKTLADVRPGGMVRLGDQAERARFEAWAEGASLNIARFNDGGYCDERTVSAWLAWLSAQPSPGGQGDALDLVMGECEQWFDVTDVDLTAAAESIIAALAARQPVGDHLAQDRKMVSQPVGVPAAWMHTHKATGRVEFGLSPMYDCDFNAVQWDSVALYAAPAQAVDLGAVREALQAAEGLATVCASVDGYSREEVAASGRAMKQQFADALAKVDSQAVGK